MKERMRVYREALQKKAQAMIEEEKPVIRVDRGHK